MKTYLGDGAYAELDDCGAVILTTENGYQTTNRVVLEREVMNALLLWLQQLGAVRLKSTEDA